MVKIRTAKAKGSQFEYDCQYSLSKLYKDIYRTSERGFQLQYDLRSDVSLTVWECKRLKGISWNQAKKFFSKLQDVKPKDYKGYLLFKSNRQPCLVMYRDDSSGFVKVVEFENFFNTKFEKHLSTRKDKGR